MLDKKRVWAEINLDNIVNNIRQIKKAINVDTKIIGVVKADAYGHGAVEVSKVLLDNGVTHLGVAMCDEGIELRQKNIFAPILIFGFSPDAKLADIILYDLSQTVFNLETAEKLSSIANRLNKLAKIHIKIDTGMSRLGFFPTKHTIEQIKKIISLPNIIVEGIYTHFATSDVKDKSFTYEQLEKFNYVLNLLKQWNINLPCHVSNSGAILDMGDFNMSYVRPGIVMYGLPPSNQTTFDKYNFLPAMSFKTQICFIKEVDCDVSIGYGRTFYTKRSTKVATIPVGYADGYARAYSNKGRVLVNGQYANIIGNVCMDQFMIDVTDIINVNVGDEVVLFGSQNGNEINVSELANISSTIEYEIVCNISKRVPRIYMKNNVLHKIVSYTTSI